MAVTYRVPGAVLTEREHRVPLDHAAPDGPSITVFTREVAAPDGADRPYLVFLQGGPGFEATRPTSPPSGWMKRALQQYRVLLLDQRGTGRSTPVGAMIPGATPADQAAYLAHFRADAIVRDCEAVRGELGSTAVDRARPELRRVHDADLPVVRAGGPARGADHRRADAGRPVRGRRLRRDVRAGGGGAGSLLRPLPRRPGPRPRHPRAARRGGRAPAGRRSADRPTVLAAGHVAGGLRGVRAAPPRAGAAVRVVGLPPRRRAGVRLGAQPDLRDAPRELVRGRRRRPAGRRRASCPTASASPTRSPPSTCSRGCGRTTPGSTATARPANLLAEHEWPRLYDADRLARNEVPVAATIYTNDVYVVRDFAVETAALVKGIRTWETNELEHNGLRADGERVLGRLLDLVQGRA